MTHPFEQRTELAEEYCATCQFRYCRCEELSVSNLSVMPSPANAMVHRANFDRDRQFENLLVEAAVLTEAQGWRTLLHAHDHVWRDREWDWRTRFSAAGMLWDKAISLCQEGMLRRTHRLSVVN